MEAKSKKFFQRAIEEKTRVESEYVSTERGSKTWKDEVITEDFLVHKYRLFNHPHSDYCVVWHEVKPDWSEEKVNMMFDFSKNNHKHNARVAPMSIKLFQANQPLYYEDLEGDFKKWEEENK